jgi:sugar lactone lactonase YvrE
MKVECVLETRDELGECPIWDPRTRRLWWVDVLAPSLQSYDPATGGHRRYAVAARAIGSFALRKRGGFALARNDGLHAFDPETGKSEPLLDPEPALPDNRLNDGRADRGGRFWVGSMEMAENMIAPTGSLFRVDPDLKVTRLLSDVTIPNSIAFSPDDRTFYFADSRQQTIWAFDLDMDSGDITNRRVFADLRGGRGGPDGSCVDADGFLWNAHFGTSRVVRYAPDGRVDRAIEFPASNLTCCAFGGDKLDVLYVTSAKILLKPDQLAAQPMAGALFAVHPGVRGLPEAAFAG